MHQQFNIQQLYAPVKNNWITYLFLPFFSYSHTYFISFFYLIYLALFLFVHYAVILFRDAVDNIAIRYGLNAHGS